ncbi:hypothetical protein ABK040_014190 [Willaertia magna]
MEGNPYKRTFTNSPSSSSPFLARNIDNNNNMEILNGGSKNISRMEGNSPVSSPSSPSFMNPSMMLLNVLKSKTNSRSAASTEFILTSLTLTNLGNVLNDWQDVVDEFVLLWLEEPHELFLSFFIWLLSIHSFLLLEYPIHIQKSILKALMNLTDKQHVIGNLTFLFQSSETRNQMMNYCKHIFEKNGNTPEWFKIIEKNTTKLELEFNNLYKYSLFLYKNPRFDVFVNSLIRFGELKSALELLEKELINLKQPIDKGYCCLWYCSLLIERNDHTINLKKESFSTLSSFVRNHLMKEKGLLKKNSRQGMVNEIPSNLFHLFDDSTFSNTFIVKDGYSSLSENEMETILHKLRQAADYFKNAGNHTLSLQIYQRLIEYYQNIKTEDDDEEKNDNQLGELYQQCANYFRYKKLGSEHLSTFRFYYISVIDELLHQYEYIYRVYFDENVDIFIENKIMKEYPNFTILTARDSQYSKLSIRILPALYVDDRCYAIFDYCAGESYNSEDEMIFGCTKKKCFTESEIMIEKSLIVNTLLISEEANQLHANIDYLSFIQMKLKSTSQSLAQNILNNVNLKDSLICFQLFVLTGNLLHDILENVHFNHLLSINHCKQLIYCYKGIFKDELADRKKEIRRKWLKEKKLAMESNNEIPPEPNLDNLIEHNEEYVALKELLVGLIETIGNSFILYKELAESIYQSKEKVLETLNNLQLMRLSMLTIMSELEEEE